MSEEEKKELRELIELLYNDNLTQYGKRNLVEYIEKLEKKIEEWQKAYIRNDNYWSKFRNTINKIANNDKDCSDNEVIKAVKNLNKENDKLTKLLLGKSLGFNDYISKDKIRDKIKELEEKMKEDEVDDFGMHSIGWGALDYIKEFLEELLEEY